MGGSLGWIDCRVNPRSGVSDRKSWSITRVHVTVSFVWGMLILFVVGSDSWGGDRYWNEVSHFLGGTRYGRNGSLFPYDDKMT